MIVGATAEYLSKFAKTIKRYGTETKKDLYALLLRDICSAQIHMH